jgi:hypothetical protein
MRGGKRPGAGRPRGAKTRERLTLAQQPVAATKKVSQRERHLELKRSICLAVSEGWSDEKISAVLKIPVDRLRAAFGHELAHGKEIIRLEQLRELDLQGQAGKVSALKTVLDNAVGERTKPVRQSDETEDRIIAGALKLLKGGKA